MTGGYITLWRKVRESWLWDLSDSDLRLALTCLLLANWKPRSWFDGKKRVVIPRGSFVTSAEKLAAECGRGFTRKKIRGGLSKLQAAEFLEIDTKKGQAWTLITILNYSKYQDKSEAEGQDTDQDGAKSGPGEGQGGATTEEGNKGTKEEGKNGVARPKRAKAIPSDWTAQAAHSALAAKLGVDLAAEAEKFRDHFTASGKPMKDWDAAFRNWLRNAAKWSKSPSQGSQRAIPEVML